MLKPYFLYFLILIIIVISFIGNWFVFETNKTESLGKLNKAMILAVWFLSIAILGYQALKFSDKKWAVALWIVQYSFVLLICMIYVLLYFFASEFPIALKTAMASIRNIYLTPFPFAFLILMEIVERRSEE
ncbi:MAG: hypothetical protein NTZ19_10055 [Bacteroidetes bacterium]|nr:hypothetical protein [Bacteroidota bacterium]